MSELSTVLVCAACVLYCVIILAFIVLMIVCVEVVGMTKTEVALIEREVLERVTSHNWCAALGNQIVRDIEQTIKDIFAKHGVSCDD